MDTVILSGVSTKNIILSAHYDHLGVIEDQIHPGADDNASGVAALLELAKSLSQRKSLPYNVVFICTAAEEPGLLGSMYHVNQPSFHPEDVLINFNIDMIGRKDTDHRHANYLYVIGTDQSEQLHALIEGVDVMDPIIEVDYQHDHSQGFGGYFTRSDQYSFHQKGILSMFFFGGLHDDYHSPSDTANKLDYNGLLHRVQFIEQVILQFQQSENFQ